MDSLSHKILLTLAKGETKIPLAQLRQQYPPEDIQDQCETLIYNKAISIEDGLLFMTSRQMANAKLIYNV